MCWSSQPCKCFRWRCSHDFIRRLFLGGWNSFPLRISLRHPFFRGMPPCDYLAISGSLCRNYVHRRVKFHLLRCFPTEVSRDALLEFLNNRIRATHLLEDVRMATQIISILASSLPRLSPSPIRSSGRYVKKDALKLNVGKTHLRLRLLLTMPIQVL